MLYCTLLPTMGAATPDGVLRALDRFDLISWQGTRDPDRPRDARRRSPSSPARRSRSMSRIWYVTDLGGDLYLWFLGWRELRAARAARRASGRRFGRRPCPARGGSRSTSISTTSVQAVWGPIARLVVGGLLGPAGAALFRVASSLADSAQKPADLLGKAFYPGDRADGPDDPRSRGS